MCCSGGDSAAAAQFSLSTGQYVSSIDVVLWGGTGSGIAFQFSLQDSLTSPTTIFASAFLATPAFQNTETLSVNATLPAGTYYLVGTEVPNSPNIASGWFLSNGTFVTNAGSVRNGIWSINVPTGQTFFNGYECGGPCPAPTFAVNTVAATVPEPRSLSLLGGCVLLGIIAMARRRRLAENQK
jgi:hypothetical protein